MSTTFETPPPPRDARGRNTVRSAELAALARDLRANPGEWAIVATPSTAESAASTAYAIRNGVYKAFQPRGAFNAKGRTLDGVHRVYVQYVPEADPIAAAVAERDMQIVRWLGKKAREYRSTGSRQHALQADAIELMASKIAGGAVVAGGEQP